MTRNVDDRTVGGFGREWSRFTQSERELTAEQRARMFADYFDIFPWSALPQDAIGVDVGCGSGRWAVLVAPRVGHLHLVDISTEALVIRPTRDCQLGNGRKQMQPVTNAASSPTHGTPRLLVHSNTDGT